MHLAAPALAELAAIAWDAGNEYFPPTTWQISNIHAGTGATNVIPGRAARAVQLPLLHGEHGRGLKARVHEILDRARARLSPRMVAVRDAVPDPARASWSMPSAAAIREELGIEPELSTTGGTSDGRFIAAICPQVVELGPVNAYDPPDQRARCDGRR